MIFIMSRLYKGQKHGTLPWVSEEAYLMKTYFFSFQPSELWGRTPVVGNDLGYVHFCLWEGFMRIICDQRENWAILKEALNCHTPQLQI